MSTIHVPRDADGWSLYRRMPGADEAGEKLGEQLHELLSGAKSLAKSGSRSERHECAVRIRDTMLEAMTEARQFGARDTEPETVLTNVVGDFMRVELSRW